MLEGINQTLNTKLRNTYSNSTSHQIMIIAEGPQIFKEILYQEPQVEPKAQQKVIQSVQTYRWYGDNLTRGNRK